jgi:hypothetical protein
MDMETRRVTVTGLRGADIATLQVLTQDVIRLPLNQIEADTLCDMFALSELEEGIPPQLALDLLAFRENRIRELNDLPDGAALSEFAQSLAALAADQVPGTLRDAVVALTPDREQSAEALTELASHLSSAEPAAVLVRAAQPEAPSPAATAAADRTTAKKPAKRKAGTRASAKDPARAEWIEEFAVFRLKNYETGLKETILVGGARHKAPWKDITEREVRSVLRRLAREGKLRISAGRWMIDR